MTTLTVAPKTRTAITVEDVRRVLAEIVDEYPRRADRRTDEHTAGRYVEWGAPNTLVAMLLLRLGFGLGVLQALDAEHPVGELFTPGVRVAESRHPALARLDPLARALIDYVQSQQNRGRQWQDIFRSAFHHARFFTRLDRERRPWLH